ncbi:MAG TPA: Na/Pi symporter [Flavobacteriales bacterium]|nr:Na/Pi symporter [Flavobacteriales bacterium]
MNDLWKLLAGLGIFIFGMSLLEDALKLLAGRTFKVFLRKNTENRFEAVLSGTIVTAVLQSSSVVSFMVLGFVGAGVLTMRNALAVVFGANLGTTLTGWMVALLGFKLDIESFSLPLITTAAAGFIAFQNRPILLQWSRFIMGTGLLFFALSYLKESTEIIVKDFDMRQYAHFSILSFVLVGFVLTAVIQASSATVVITLTALHAKIIPFESGAAIVAGSELGSAVKLLYVSFTGQAAKRRVAVGNILFNVTTTLTGYFFIYQFIALIQFIVGKDEPLIGLVLFQTCINFAGLIVFLPLLDPLSRFLEKRFSKSEKRSTAFITDTNAKIPEEAAKAMEKETWFFINRVIYLTGNSFHLSDKFFNVKDEFIKLIESNEGKLGSFNDKYDLIKKAEGEILLSYMKLRDKKSSDREHDRIQVLMAAVRNAMYSLKEIKDIRHNRNELRDSADDKKYAEYTHLKGQLLTFYEKLEQIISLQQNSKQCSKAFIELLQFLRTDYNHRMEKIYQLATRNTLTEAEISSLLNVNREMYSSCKAMLFAMKDYLLDAEDARAFEELPVAV